MCGLCAATYSGERLRGARAKGMRGRFRICYYCDAVHKNRTFPDTYEQNSACGWVCLRVDFDITRRARKRPCTNGSQWTALRTGLQPRAVRKAAQTTRTPHGNAAGVFGPLHPQGAPSASRSRRSRMKCAVDRDSCNALHQHKALSDTLEQFPTCVSVLFCLFSYREGHGSVRVRAVASDTDNSVLEAQSRSPAKRYGRANSAAVPKSTTKPMRNGPKWSANRP